MCFCVWTVPPDFRNLRPFSDSTVRLRTLASIIEWYCPISETCVRFRMLSPDFGPLASVFRQYRQSSNFRNRTAVVSRCAAKRSYHRCKVLVLNHIGNSLKNTSVKSSYSKTPQLKVLLLLTTGIIPSNNLSCDRKTFMIGFISTVIFCGLVLFVVVVGGRL